MTLPSQIDRRAFLQAGALAAGAASAAWSAPARAALGGAVRGLAPEEAAAHVLNRLGFGPRPGDLAAVARDPRGWIEQQLAPGSMPLPAALASKLRESRFTSMDPIAAARDLVELERERREMMRSRAQAAPDAPMAAASEPAAPEMAGPARYVRDLELPALESRLFRALESPRQLEEVMVDFWFNHFNVFQGKNLVRVWVGHYEQYAIRPFALGRFRDLLGATAHHPAMLFYLDNWQSAGSDAGGGARRRGLNENYARELMELHTLGVDGGYTQQDVTQLARMLTGWTFVPLRAGPRRGAPMQADIVPPGDSEHVPGFWFDSRMHDDGQKVWLGRTILPRGKAEGNFALDVLARHPSTARNISFKLAQYFVGDDPPRPLVDRMAATFQANDGQIVPVLRELFASDAFWVPSSVAAKFKTPYHYALSVLRAGGWTIDDPMPLARAIGAQGMPLFGCLTPDGYKNTESAWLTPDAMTKRINFAAQVASGRLGRDMLGGGLDPDALLDSLGPLATPATRDLARQHRQEPGLALALLLAGPGMMRR